MAADGGEGASFTVRLINQVSAPARQVKSDMAGVSKAMASAQKALSAPASKRGGLSDWDKMLGGAKKSQALDFAKQATAASKAREKEQKRAAGVSKRIAQEHADHSMTAMVGEGGSSMALGAGIAVATAAVAAAAAVGYMGIKFAEASVEAGIFAEKSQLAIGFLTNNAPQAAAQFDEVRHMAQTLGLQVDETVGSFERLLAMQFDVGKSKDLIKMAADMQAIGANGEEVQRILYAISEIKSMGTLQKRQERMLQMAGISGTLIDAALMKHTGITDHGKLEKARAKGQIGADVAVDAIMEAVMHKTHESKLGDAGAAFASQTVAGMQAQFHAKMDNMFTDVGVLLMPGVTKLAQLFSGLFDTIINDPQIQGVGQFLLSEFEYFTMWVDGNWPEISATLVSGAELVADSFRFVVELFDTSTAKGAIFAGTMYTLAAVFGVLAIAVAIMMAPIYAIIAVIGAVAYAVVSAIEWIWGAIKGLASWFTGSDTNGAVNAATLPQMEGPGGAGAGVSANDNGIQAQSASGGFAALASMQGDTTESANATGQQPINVVQHITVPQADDPQRQAALIGQEVHSQIATIMRQAG
jgi:hypothetical protein